MHLHRVRMRGERKRGERGRWGRRGKDKEEKRCGGREREKEKGDGKGGRDIQREGERRLNG